MSMNAEQARNFLSNRKRAVQDVATPFWSEKDAGGEETGLDGHIQIRKLSGSEAFDLDKIADTKTRTAMLLSMCLLIKDTGEPLYQLTGASLALDDDVENMRVLAKECLSYNGMAVAGTPDVEEAKKN